MLDVVSSPIVRLAVALAVPNVAVTDSVCWAGTTEVATRKVPVVEPGGIVTELGNVIGPVPDMVTVSPPGPAAGDTVTLHVAAFPPTMVEAERRRP